MFSQDTSHQLVFGTERLMMSEKLWMRRNKQTVLHQGEGLIRSIKWQGNLIAWSNDNGTKLYDTKQKRRIQHIPRIGAVSTLSDTSSTVTGMTAATSVTRPNGGETMVCNSEDAIRCEISPAHLVWKDDSTLLIGWAYDIKVVLIKERTSRRDSSKKTKFCVIAHMFQTDFLCCGIAPLGEQLVAFAYVEEEETQDDEDEEDETTSEEGSNDGSFRGVEERTANTKKIKACRPQLRILEASPVDNKSYIEVSRDALSISGYADYRCADYSLEFNDSELLVISPKAVVIARRRDEDDHISWLLETNQFKEAVGAVKVFGRRLKKHTLSEVGLQYLYYLLDQKKFYKAAEECSEVLGKNRVLWEDMVEKFSKEGQLSIISQIIPHEDFSLPSNCYDLVLQDALKNDHENFVNLLNKWSYKLFNIPTMISKLLRYMDETKRKKELLGALAKLYEADQRYDRALSTYLQLKHPDTFDLIRKHNLFSALPDNILPLMQFGGSDAIELLLDNMDYVPIDKVVAELENHDRLLHKYLNALFIHDANLGSEYRLLQVRLYADFDRKKLLPFLKSSNFIPLQKALEICEQRNLIDAQVHLHSRMGNNSRALSLITDHDNNITRAVKFCKEQNDDDLWDELIDKSLNKPEFIRKLLENIGTHVDPIKLIRKIPYGMEIPGLRDALVKILQDYSMQTALWFQCKKIISSDVIAMMRKQQLVQHRPLYLDGDSLCDACGRHLIGKSTVSYPTFDSSFPILFCFFCRHLFHDSCLQGQNRGTCSVCRGKVRHL